MFGVRFHRQITTGPTSRLNVSLGGLSESIKLSDRVTLNSRTGLTIRLAKGLSIRTGKLW